MTLVNPSEVSREKNNKVRPFTKKISDLGQEHPLFLPVDSSACQHVVPWCSLLLMAVSLPPSLPSADMP